MYESTRSYLSRFSGAILFILALIVVGVLIFLTVRSARDDDTSVQETSSVISSADDETAVFGSIDSDSGVVTVDDSASDPNRQVQVVASSDQPVSDEVVASSNDNPQEELSNTGSVLPNTGTTGVLAGLAGFSIFSLAIAGYARSRTRLSKDLLKS